MFNLAIFGKTGVGKSTLINAVFGEDVARTGTGRPVTTKTDYYEHPDGYLGIYDSEGIEVGQEGDEILEKLRQIIRDKRKLPVREHIHVIWYCVRAGDLRFEDGQAEFVNSLTREGIPVVFVLTQVATNAAGDIHPEQRALADSIEGREMRLAPENRVFFTRALPDDFTGMPSHGLPALLDATFRVAPEGVQRALTAAQKIDMSRKAKEARKVVGAAMGAAASAAATPIPFSDAFLLVPIQVGLMGKTAAIYGLSIKRGTLASVAGAAFAAGGITQLGKYIVTNAMKFVPVANVAASMIRAGVASALTYAVGEAWIVVCSRLVQMGPVAAAAMSTEDLQKMFLKEFRKKAKGRRVQEEIQALDGA